MEDKKFEDIFNEYNYTERLENSLQSYLNWLLGISIGLGAVVYTTVDKMEDKNYYFIITFILILIGILFNGIIKYLIHNREIKMSVAFGELKKIKILREANKELINTKNNMQDASKWQQSFSKHSLQSDKINSIAKLITFSTIITFLNVINSGIYTIYLFIIPC